MKESLSYFITNESGLFDLIGKLKAIELVRCRFVRELKYKLGLKLKIAKLIDNMNYFL